MQSSCQQVVNRPAGLKSLPLTLGIGKKFRLEQAELL
jgi:hypothetical protein